MSDPRVRMRDLDREENMALLPKPNRPHAFQRSHLNTACTVCGAHRKDYAMRHTNREEPSR